MMKKFFLMLGLIGSVYSTTLLATETQPVNVNTADQSQLESIKGIGPKQARAILDEREKNGPFKDSEDLKKRVKGIGDKSLKRLQENGLTVDDAKTPASNSDSQKKQKIKKDKENSNNKKQ
jgi:competence protein ComEA